MAQGMVSYYGKVVPIDFAIVDLFEALKRECNVGKTEGIGEVAKNFAISTDTVRRVLVEKSEVFRGMVGPIRKGMRVFGPEDREELLRGFDQEIESRLKYGMGSINEFCERRAFRYKVSSGAVRDVIRKHPGYHLYVKKIAKKCGK